MVADKRGRETWFKPLTTYINNRNRSLGLVATSVFDEKLTEENNEEEVKSSEIITKLNA